MNDAQKLEKLRAEMDKAGVAAFIVPRTDEYQGEYVAANAERLAWLTGFTGSAGLAIVTMHKAVVMSDGRYFSRLPLQVDLDVYEIQNSQIMKPEEWLKKNLQEGDVIGYDPRLHTAEQIYKKEKNGLLLKPVSNLIDTIWEGRPSPPLSKANLFDKKTVGADVSKKIKTIQQTIEKHDADGAVITLSDSIAWLLNIRGDDIPYTPVILSYAYVPRDGKVQWFVSPKKIEKVKEVLSEFVDFHDESEIEGHLKKLSGHKVMCDPKRSSIWFRNILHDVRAETIEENDPCLLPRACKNEFEQESMKRAHIRDGVALVKFLHWFEKKHDDNKLDELSLEKKLKELRSQAPEYKGYSFPIIFGYAENGAIIHYRSNEKTNKEITSGSLLLFDTGAQYEDGTTDITRTIAVGEPTQEMKERNTLVLKGHIALATAKFDKKTTGKELDQLARQFLKEQNLDYAHGTGHGVGCYLSVHEEAAMGISPRAEEPLSAGMIVSNEPGYYKEGEYGIRIENLIMVKEDGDELSFETISFCPLDKNLMVTSMLDRHEIDWINDYHDQVFEKLSPHLDDAAKVWLKEQTKPLAYDEPDTKFRLNTLVL